MLGMLGSYMKIELNSKYNWMRLNILALLCMKKPAVEQFSTINFWYIQPYKERGFRCWGCYVVI